MTGCTSWQTGRWGTFKFHRDSYAVEEQGRGSWCFPITGWKPTVPDLPSLVFLPELLYRWSFPGRLGLERGPDRLSPATAPAGKRPWAHEVWALKHDRNPVTRALRHRLPVEFFHYAIERRLGINGVPLCPDDCILGYQPPMWYSPSWPEMKAFALPSFSEGYVRLNVRGRERDGVIEPADYSRVCDEIEGLLGQVRNARTGSPMLRKVLRSRASALRHGSKAAGRLICSFSGLLSRLMSSIRRSGVSALCRSTDQGVTSNAASCWRVERHSRRGEPGRSAGDGSCANDPLVARCPSTRLHARQSIVHWRRGRREAAFQRRHPGRSGELSCGDER